MNWKYVVCVVLIPQKITESINTSSLFFIMFIAKRAKVLSTLTSTLNFELSPMILGGTVRAIRKNDPQWQRTRFQLELRRNSRFYVRPKNVFLAKKDTYLGKRNFFLCTTFPVRDQIMVSIKKSTLFRAQKLGFRPKSPIFAMRPGSDGIPVPDPSRTFFQIPTPTCPDPKI